MPVPSYRTDEFFAPSQLKQTQQVNLQELSIEELLLLLLLVIPTDDQVDS